MEVEGVDEVTNHVYDAANAVNADCPSLKRDLRPSSPGGTG